MYPYAISSFLHCLIKFTHKNLICCENAENSWPNVNGTASCLCLCIDMGQIMGAGLVKYSINVLPIIV